MYLVTHGGWKDYISTDRIVSEVEKRGATASVEGVYTFPSDEGSIVTCTPCKADRLEWLSGLFDYRDPLTNKRVPNPSRTEDDVPAKVASPVARCLLAEGVSYLRVRHIMKHKLSFGIVNNAPALSLRGKDAKTGKLLRKLLPKGTSDKYIELFSAQINDLNPSVSRIKAMRDTVVENGLNAAEQGGRVGSCMHGEKTWKNLDKYLVQGIASPDFSRPPTQSGAVYTVRWPNMVDKAVTSGHESMRAFVWAAELDNGKRVWYLDRIYPANGKAANLWAKEWADMVGIELVNTEFFSRNEEGVYGDRAEAQPKMFLPLAKEIDLSDRLPWLDTFRYVSTDGMRLQTPKCGKGCGADAHITTGRWENNLEDAIPVPAEEEVAPSLATSYYPRF